MSVRTNRMPLPGCGKCDYFTDTPGCKLFKVHNIQNHLVLPEQQTPLVLHSFHSQHFQSGTQRLVSDNVFLLGKRDEMYLSLWIIPHHFPHVQIFLDTCKNTMPCLSLLLELLILILLHFPYCRVCSALRWKQCMWTLQKQLWGIWCLWICLCDGKSSPWFYWQ